jgi:hypothetical protein
VGRAKQERSHGESERRSIESGAPTGAPAPGRVGGAGARQGVDVPFRGGDLAGAEQRGEGVDGMLEGSGHHGAVPPHGLRRTFNDQLRRAGVDPVTAKSLTGHVTESMREHYSTVGLDEKRAAVASVHRLLPRPHRTSADSGADGAPGADPAKEPLASKAAESGAFSGAGEGI